MFQGTTRSERAYEAAQKVMPGGVNSPVRAFHAVEGPPVFIAEGRGSHLIDIDGNEYIDYCLSWGPLILGHAHPDVVRAITETAARGTSFGAPTLLETELAERVCQLMPSVEVVRMVNSGTEATMSALRVARAYTRRDRVVKFIGCYHGHGDSFLVKAGSGVATLGLPDSPGVPEGVTANTIALPYNDLDAVRDTFAKVGEGIAAVIVEPVPGNMGLVLPRAGFLEGLREITREYGALLIFDEVMTGFRVARGGAQERFGIDPDLTTFGKVIGGGLPVGAFGGKRSIMELVAPAGPVYQAGTLSGNPLAMAAGLATLSHLNEDVYRRFEEMSKRLVDGLVEAARETGIPVYAAASGSMYGFYFSEEPVVDYESAKRADGRRFAKYHRLMLERGVYLPPAQLEARFLSTAHSDADLDRTLEAHRNALKRL
ncbi:glutamate-1-semialdehyde 2,1-aminomutase [Kyrpidia sp.]|uniref:glutamate-1-semialdehyde 2,1-aminomutase n=1 Tax=Kyrpidia sp. TaxID=2073077 RepID=UPI00258983EE|nr:glutamate-1-semialdehyde 2,1-aminomutase [Kyrpidia sp.]MCL6575610.1 glutamate-1-semialdehyde 2,1-aminomutase [Kyrpidia sp.]